MTVVCPIRTVDVFTEARFAGNQLAVVLGADRIPPERMQDIAREMNLSETTFVMKPHKAENTASVRIFTPAAELPFAGHPTVGTAWVLWKEGLAAASGSVVLEEGVGPVSVRAEPRAGGSTRFWMTHPPVTLGEVRGDRDRIATAIGLEVSALADKAPVQVASTGVPFLFVCLRSVADVDRARSDRALLTEALGEGGHAIFLFAVAGDRRLYSRMFAPHSLGITEDPATGSASGPLGAFAVHHGLIARAASVAITSEQGTLMGRRSLVHIALEYSGDHELPARVEVGGDVVPVISGEITIES